MLYIDICYTYMVCDILIAAIARYIPWSQVACMERPFGNDPATEMLVDLVVDSKYANTWYEAK